MAFLAFPTPLNPAPATCHKRKRKLRCSFRNAALQKLHCNIGFSAVRKSFGPKAALQQTKNCTATSKKLRCRKVALSCRFPAGFKPPRLGTHVSVARTCPFACFHKNTAHHTYRRISPVATTLAFRERCLSGQ